MKRARNLLARRVRRRDERGAIAVLTALMLSIVLLAAAFVVDIGMQRVLRADLQALTDMVALDMSRDLTGKMVKEYSGAERAAFDSALIASVGRNRSTVGGAVDPTDLTWDFMKRDAVTRKYVVAGPNDVATAVRVSARSDIGFAFGGITGMESGTASREAVAARNKRACIKVSSYAAQLETGKSWLLKPLLGQLLGSNISLGLLDPENGLLKTDIALLDFIEELDPLIGVDLSALSFTSVANTTVGLSELVLATIKALEKDSKRIAEVDLLRQVLGGIQANVPHLDVKLSDLVELDTAGESAVGLDVNVFDLITGALAIANGTNVIDLPLGVKIPIPLGSGGAPLINLAARLTVGQAPVVSCTGHAESSQIVIELSGKAVDLNLGVVKVEAPLRVRVTLADASANVRDVTCENNSKRIKLAINSGLLGVTVNLGQYPGQDKKLRVALFDIGLPGWNGVEVVSGNVLLNSGQSTSRPTLYRDLVISEENYQVKIPASEGGLGIPTLHLALNELKLLGGLGPLSDLLDFLRIPNLLQGVVNLVLEGLVNPLVSTLDKWLLDPLVKSLGLNLAGGTVQAAPTADCGIPKLVG